MRYIDCNKNRNYSVEELQALVNGNAKPYPCGWYENEADIIARRNDAIADVIESVEELDNYSEISCPVEKWAYLYRTI